MGSHFTWRYMSTIVYHFSILVLQCHKIMLNVLLWWWIFKVNIKYSSFCSVVYAPVFFIYFMLSPSVLEVGTDSLFLSYMSRRIDFSWILEYLKLIVTFHKFTKAPKKQEIDFVLGVGSRREIDFFPVFLQKLCLPSSWWMNLVLSGGGSL